MDRGVRIDPSSPLRMKGYIAFLHEAVLVRPDGRGAGPRQTSKWAHTPLLQTKFVIPGDKLWVNFFN